MRRTPQKWYNMQYINMSGKLPMGIAAKVPRVRCSAAYPTGAECGVFSHVELVECRWWKSMRIKVLLKGGSF